MIIKVEQIAKTEQGNIDYLIYTGDAPAHDVWLQVIIIKLLECPIPAPSSVLLLCPLSQKIRITSVLAVFLKLGQMDFSKASNSISHHLTSIFPRKK